MQFSQALNAMLRGHKVALKSEPGIEYTFDGAEGYCIWAYYEATDDLVHVDNVSFDRMLKDDWYVIPKAAYGVQHSTRRWRVMNWLTTARFSHIDAIGALLAGGAGVGFGWATALTIVIIVTPLSIILERKWKTNV